MPGFVAVRPMWRGSPRRRGSGSRVIRPAHDDVPPCCRAGGARRLRGRRVSVLLPALEARGERSRSGAGRASARSTPRRWPRWPTSRRPSRRRIGVRVVGELRKGDVIAPIVGQRRRCGRRCALLGHGLGRPGHCGSPACWTPRPLAGEPRSLDRLATSSPQRRRRVAWTRCALSPPRWPRRAGGVRRGRAPGARRAPGRNDRYVRDPNCSGEHVRASAAIPMLFPTVEIMSPRSARGHYADGGTRLNSPIKPALHLGADRVILIGLEPFGRTPGSHVASPARPSVADVAANVLDGLLVDQVANDLHRLAAINSFFVEDATRRDERLLARLPALPRARALPADLLRARLAPARGEIGRLAETVLARRYGGLRRLREPDFMIIAAALGSRTRARGRAACPFCCSTRSSSPRCCGSARATRAAGCAAIRASGAATQPTTCPSPATTQRQSTSRKRSPSSERAARTEHRPPGPPRRPLPLLGQLAKAGWPGGVGGLPGRLPDCRHRPPRFAARDKRRTCCA